MPNTTTLTSMMQSPITSSRTTPNRTSIQQKRLTKQKQKKQKQKPTNPYPTRNPPRNRALTPSMADSLISSFDAVLSDLDGVVYAGPHAIPGAVESLQRLETVGVGLGYVTNNASRTPAQVAAHLRELGAPAE